jgi:transcriptional regulator with XRE-family HTH domain
VTDSEIRDRLKRCVTAAGSQRALADKIGVSAPYLSDVLNGNRNPGPKVLAYLGLERHYRKKVGR